METYQIFIINHLKESIHTKEQVIEELVPEIDQASAELCDHLKAGHKIMLCGNGGSAADAQHIAAEMVVRLKSSNDRPAIPAIALTVDSSILTAASNDYGFEQVFARQVEALGQGGDVLIAISTSGNSANVIKAVEKAREKNIVIIGLLGADGGELKELVDVPIVIPSEVTAHIQECHMTIGHIFCDIVEQELFGE